MYVVVISILHYANSGAYDPVADMLFGEENVNAYYLEFDDERSGGFAPLAKVSGDKKVVLGLITTKSPKLENKEEVIAPYTRSSKLYSTWTDCISVRSVDLHPVRSVIS